MCNCSETETAASPMPFSGNHTHPLATTCTAGVIELATAAEAVANPTFIDALAITPYTLGHYTGLVDQVATVETSDLLLVRDVSANKDVSYTFGALKDAVTPPQATTESLGIIELATDAEVIAGTDAERAVTPAGLEAWSAANPATEADRGLIELATEAEVIAGSDAERAVTPAGLEAWSAANPATEADRGLIELATDVEVITGTDTERAVTPAGLEAWSVANPATETDRGLIELATDAEVIAGTDTERAVTPAGLALWSGANQISQYVGTPTSNLSFQADSFPMLPMGNLSVINGAETEASLSNGELVLNQAGWYFLSASTFIPDVSGVTVINLKVSDSGGQMLHYISVTNGDSVETSAFISRITDLFMLPAGARIAMSLNYRGSSSTVTVDAARSQIRATRIAS